MNTPLLDKLKEFYRAFIGAFIIIGVFVLIGLLYFVPIPAGNEKIIYMGIGTIIGYGGAVVNFDFGSSRGSESKTAIMADKENNTTTKAVTVTETTKAP